MAKCVVYGCKSGHSGDEWKRKAKGLRKRTLFQVPKCHTRRQLWVNALQQELTDSDRVCELHFSNKYIVKGKSVLINGKNIFIENRWYLKDNAIPIGKDDYQNQQSMFCDQSNEEEELCLLSEQQIRDQDEHILLVEPEAFQPAEVTLEHMESPVGETESKSCVVDKSKQNEKCVFECKHLSSTPLHSFPDPARDLDLFEKWRQATQHVIEESDPLTIYKKYKICHEHFTADMKVKKYILRDAVPCLNLKDENTTKRKKKVTINEVLPKQDKSLQARPTKYSNLVPIGDRTLKTEITIDNIYGPVPGNDVVSEDHDYMMMYDDENMDDLSSINIVKKVEKVPEKQSETVHEGYSCNVCENLISGFRYTCVQCRDFDLCSACEAKGEHSSHYVLRIPKFKAHEDFEELLRSIRRGLFGEKIAPNRNTSPIEHFDPLLDEIQEEPLLYSMATYKPCFETQEQHSPKIQSQDIQSESHEQPKTVIRSYSNKWKKTLPNIKENTLTQKKENFKLDSVMPNITLNRKVTDQLIYQPDPLSTTDRERDVILQDGSRNGSNIFYGALKFSSRWPPNSPTKVIKKETNQKIATPKIIICKSKSIRYVKFKKLRVALKRLTQEEIDAAVNKFKS